MSGAMRFALALALSICAATAPAQDYPTRRSG